MVEIEYFRTESGRYPLKDFIDGLDVKLQAKTIASIDMLATAGSLLRMPYSRHLVDGLHELRAERNGVAIRILYFFHDGTAILTNAFVKKTRTTPLRELALAKARRTAYLQGRRRL